MNITQGMYELLKKYETWEAKLLNSENYSVIDAMSDEEYQSLLKLQNKRNELIYRYEEETK